MSLIATNLNGVPQGYHWYVFFLEDSMKDVFRKEVSENFVSFGSDAGVNILAVSGTNADHFYNDIFDKYLLYTESWKPEYSRPAILITDTPPSAVGEGTEARLAIKKIIIPLRDVYTGPGSISDFLLNLSETLRSPDAMRASEEENQLEIERWWCRIHQYFEIKPNFSGWGININQILQDMCVENR